MKVKVFTLPWRSQAGGFDDAEVSSFLETRTAIDVSEHFFVYATKFPSPKGEGRRRPSSSWW